MFCPHCGKEVAEDQLFCHHCGAKLREEGMVPETAPAQKEARPPVAEAAPDLGGRGKTPWEDRETRGFFSGLFRTMNDSLFHPSEFFRKMSVTGGFTDPLLYALIVGMVGLMFSYLWQIVMKGAVQNVMPAVQGQYMFEGIGLAVMAFFSPLLVIVGLFVSAGVLHLCLMMVKGARSGFETTFRVVSYGYSANIFLIIPFCGGLLTFVWAIVLYIIGLREAHETTGGKAAFAVFLPLIVCCGAVIFFITVLMSMAALSFGSLMQHIQQ